MAWQDVQGRVELTEQARALGDPTRFAIFEHLAASDTPLGVSELTAAFGLHHNAIRQHLRRLAQAGLVLEERVLRPTRGRPPLHYRLTPGAVDRWTHPSPQEALAGMLLDLVVSGDPPRQVGKRAGAKLAGEISGGSGALDMLEGVTRLLGFEPLRVRSEESVDFVLRHCPFSAQARSAPDVVCELHRGLADGVCEVTGDQIEVADLVVGDPDRGNCRLILRAGISAAARPL